MIETLEKYLRNVLQELEHEYPSDVVVSEPPAHIGADFATNVALQVARAASANPREVAEKVREKLLANADISNVEIAGPGFLNIVLAESAYTNALANEQPSPKDNKKVTVEYISANPTGPLHIGNARGGPMGETIARVLEKQGNKVHRDFYVNNVGGQANVFAASVLYHYKLHFGVESTFPEKGYPAPYVQELGEEIATAEGDYILHLPEAEQVEAMRKTAIDRQVAKIRGTVERMGIHFDTWSNESELVESGRSAAVLELLQHNNATFEKDGAVWLSADMHDEDRETVLVKSDGTTTYFLDDIAFYRMKLDEWGNEYGVCVLGPGHVDHITRMKAGLRGIGLDPERYRGSVYQHVQLKENGEKKKMTKREGTFVTADQVLDEIPRDVFTWFMLSKAAETHLDFDFQLATDTSEKNPVYYVQYAHARICSVLAKAEGYDKNITTAGLGFNPEERSLIRHLAAFERVIADVAATYRTHLIPAYVYELATRYHHFYAHNRVMSDDLTEAAQRLRLSALTAATIKEGLQLMNIVAQDRM